MTHFRKSVAEGTRLFADKEECAQFGFSCAGKDFAHDVA